VFIDYLVHRDAADPPVLPPGKAYAYVLAGNGLWKLAANRHVECLIPVARCRVAGLPRLATRIHLRCGKLPGHLLETILGNARQRSWARPTEALYYVQVEHGHTCRAQREVRVTYPRQEVGGAHVTYSGNGGPAVVCEIHSHHEMRAFFSGTDDLDENEFRFYAVCGHIYTAPQMQLRLGVYGDFCPVPLATLFADAGPFQDGHDATAT